MKTFKLLFFAVLSFSPISVCFCQWTEITNFNQVVDDLLVFDNELFICGSFTQRDGETSYWFTRYDGSTFNDYPIPLAGTGLRNMALFDNTVYAVGGQGVYTWNGSTWVNTSTGNSHSSIHVENNTLYVGSDFGVVRYKTPSGSWTTLPTLEGFSETVQALTFYNGELIVAGEFENFGSTVLNGVARWDGTTWQPLGAGIDGGVSGSQVRSIAVYNGALYLSGSFTKAGGQSIKNIAKWDGTSWSDVGGSNTGGGFNGVRDMLVYNGALYVCGDFSELGNVTAKYVAKWDGSNWTSLDLNESENFPECITVYNGDLYVGTFDFSLANLYKKSIGTPTRQIEKDIIVKVWPNPASDAIHVWLSPQVIGQFSTMAITNALGANVQSYPIPTETISCQGWPSGTYTLQLIGKDGKRIGAGQVMVQ